MIVIAKNAEEKFLSELQVYRKENPSARCYCMVLSRTSLPRGELFRRFLQLLQDMPPSFMARIYICRDRDVLILMQDFMERQFSAFLDHLARDVNMPDIKDMGQVLEVGRHWRELENICRVKMDAPEQKGNETENYALTRNEREQERKEKILAELPTDKVCSIKLRRAGRQGPRIMIADDDELSCALVERALKDKFEIVFAKNGQEAISGFVDWAPDILLLDIGLPDINGHEVLQVLFQIDPEAFVIMLSGHQDKENIMQALYEGAYGFLGKPFTQDKLYFHIEQSPDIRRKMRRTNVVK